MKVTISKIINSNVVLPFQLYKTTLSFVYSPPPLPTHLSPPQVHYVINVWLLFSQTSADTQYLNPRAGRLHENETVVKWFISINKYRTSWKFITKISRLWKQYKTPYTNTIVNSRPNSALCLEVSRLNVTDYTHNNLSWNQNLWKFHNPSTVRKHFF